MSVIGAQLAAELDRQEANQVAEAATPQTPEETYRLGATPDEYLESLNRLFSKDQEVLEVLQSYATALVRDSSTTTDERGGQ